MGATPERRAVERIKRKATGMAIAAAAAADGSAEGEGELDASTDVAPDSGAPLLARKCRCADREVLAYRDGAEWVCHTCGYELSAHAVRQLSMRARMPDSDRYGHLKWDARANPVA